MRLRRLGVSLLALSWRAATWTLRVVRRLGSLLLWAVAGALFMWCCVVSYCAAKCWPEAAMGQSTAANALELLAAFLRDARARMAAEAQAGAERAAAPIATPDADILREFPDVAPGRVN